MIHTRWQRHLLVGAFLLSNVLTATEKASNWTYIKETPEQHSAKMQWWNEARFGMFVHWGVYAATGGEYNGNYPDWSAGAPKKMTWEELQTVRNH